MAEPELKIQTPWEEIRDCIVRNDAAGLTETLDRIPSSDVARALARLDDEERMRVFQMLDPEDAADVIEELEDSQGADILEDLPAHEAAPILDAMESDRRADIVGELEEEDAEEILSRMDPEEAQDVRELLLHDPESAGGVMMTEYLSYAGDTEVGRVLREVREQTDAGDEVGLPYAYVLSESGKLAGVL